MSTPTPDDATVDAIFRAAWPAVTMAQCAAILVLLRAGKVPLPEDVPQIAALRAKLATAEGALEISGHTRCVGVAGWKPPLGKRPPFEEVDELCAQEAERIDKVKTNKGHDDIGKTDFNLEVDWALSGNVRIYSRHATLEAAVRALNGILASSDRPNRWRIFRSTTIEEPLVASGNFSDDDAVKRQK